MNMPLENKGDLYLVLGMGNPLLSDDNIGLKAVECAESRLGARRMRTAFKKNYSGGIDLLYDLVGYDKAIIVDSLVTGKASPGYCHTFSLTTIDDTVQEHCVFAHGISLATVFRIGEQCGYSMPAETVIFAVESSDITTFSEKLTPALEGSVEEIIRKINRSLSRWIDEAKTTATTPGPCGLAVKDRRQKESPDILTHSPSEVFT
jgi:hydrogenase maturation protease